jgi:chromosome segregation ATPase
MLNAATIQKQLEDLATRLEKTYPDTAVDLRDLGDAIQGGPTADAWAFCDIRAIINSGKMSSALKSDASADIIARGLEVVRNSLILLPLAVTWFGIAFAVNAYYSLISAKPALAAQSFIYLWQSGFEKRTDLSLGTLAVIDGSLLFLVFLLTLAVYARSAWVSLMNQRFGGKLVSELDHALAQAELFLAPKRAPQPYDTIHQLEQNIERLLNEIATERQRLSDLAQKREQELGDLKDFAKHLKQGAETILGAAQSLENTQTENLASIAGLTGAIKGLSDTQQDVMNSARDVAKRIDGLIAQQQQASQDASAGIEKVITEQQAATRSLAAEIQGSIVAQQMSTNELASRIDGLIKEEERANQETIAHLEGLVSEQQRVIQSLEQYTTEHKAASDVIVNALDTFTQSTKDLSGVSAIAQGLATEQGNLIQALRSESEAQNKVAIYVSQSTAGVENALLQINESSTTIRGIAADLTTIAQTLPAILNPIQVDLVNIFREHRDTAEAISRASANLETATSTLDQALQGLAPLLSSITDNTRALADAVTALQQRSIPYNRP